MREGVRESERDTVSLREREGERDSVCVRESKRYCLCERGDKSDRKGEREIQSYIHSME